MSDPDLFKIFDRDVSRAQGGNPRPGYRIYDSKKEQQLVEHIFDESVQKIGIDVIYMPRTFVNVDRVLGEDRYSKFEENRMFPLKMYMPKVDRWAGKHEIFRAEGIFIDDEVILEMAMRRFSIESKKYIGVEDLKPAEGDLIKIVMSDDLFEVKFIEFENAAFYHRGHRYTYQFHCKKFVKGGEDFVGATPTPPFEIEEIEDINLYDQIIPERGGNQVIDADTKNIQDPIIDPSEDNIFGDY